jgi:hypothetical protein
MNLNVPSTAPSGINAIACTYAGVATQSGAFIAVQQ